MYLNRTVPLRQKESRLFISFIKPHKAVTSSSIARWLLFTFDNSGVNASIFGAHSTRRALASAASKASITTSDILKATNWSSRIRVSFPTRVSYREEVAWEGCGRFVDTRFVDLSLVDYQLIIQLHPRTQINGYAKTPMHTN